MRRSAPPPTLRIDPHDPGPWARVAAGPRGHGLVEDATPDALLAPGDALRPVRGAPAPAHEATIVAAGQLALTVGPGVARTLRLPQLSVAFDRRPPGVARVAGAAGANAGLLLGDDGWRAVVLPSLGDLVAELGPGPVAIRGDGRRLARARDGAIEEIDLPDGTVGERHAPVVEALGYAADGRLIAARGDAVGSPPGPAGGGPPVVSLAVATAAPVALARHADGSCSVWHSDSSEPVARWDAPLAGPLSMSLSADGALAAFGTPFAEPAAVALVRTSDGALVRRIAGARAIALHPSGETVLIGGEWGVMWLEPPREDR